MGLKSLTHYYLAPRVPSRDPLSVDLDQASEQVKAVGSIHDTDQVDLSAFKQNGGKMLIYQGVSDPIFRQLISKIGIKAYNKRSKIRNILQNCFSCRQ